MLALDQVRDIENHFAALGQPAAYLFVKRKEEPVHLEAHGPRPCLTLTSARGVLSQAAQIFTADAFGRLLVFQSVGTAILDHDLEVHFGLAAQLLEVPHELALVRPDRLAQALIVVENRAEPEGQHGGMLKAVGDHAGMIHACFLIQIVGGCVLADDDGEVACRVEEYLVSAYAEN